MFQLVVEEWDNLWFQIETTNSNMNRTFSINLSEDKIVVQGLTVKVNKLIQEKKD